MDADALRHRAVALLLADTDAIAQAVTEGIYRAHPALMERFGDAGRLRCREDIVFTIGHLVPAIELGDTEIFVRYVRWLDELLRARHVPRADVRRSLELIGDEAARRYPADDAARIAAPLQAGLALLHDEVAP